MKKILATLVCFVFLLPFLSAEKIEQPTMAQLKGTWSGGLFQGIEFDNNGTYEAHTGWAADNMSFEGEYSLSNGKVILNPKPIKDKDLYSQYYKLFINKSEWTMYDTSTDNKTLDIEYGYDSLYYTLELRTADKVFYNLDSKISIGSTITIDGEKLVYLGQKPIYIKRKILITGNISSNQDHEDEPKYINPGTILHAEFKTLKGDKRYLADVSNVLGDPRLPVLNWIPADALGAAIINENNVNYRDKPSLNGKVIGQFNKGDTLYLQDSDNMQEIGSFGWHRWYQFQTKKGETAWVFGAFIE